MRKILFLLVIVALSACSSKTSKTTVEDRVETSATDTTALIQRVTDIYDVAVKHYGDMRNQGTAEQLVRLDSLFCSADWNAWVKRVNDFDARENSGMVGFFEADYWIMGQDWQDLSVSDVHVAAMTDSTANVELNLHNCGNVTAVKLDMVLEGDVWKIDNFVDATNDVDWKSGMKEYMSGK